jgi:hypothetical protein
MRSVTLAIYLQMRLHSTELHVNRNNYWVSVWRSDEHRRNVRPVRIAETEYAAVNARAFRDQNPRNQLKKGKAMSEIKVVPCPIYTNGEHILEVVGTLGKGATECQCGFRIPARPVETRPPAPTAVFSNEPRYFNGNGVEEKFEPIEQAAPPRPLDLAYEFLYAARNKVANRHDYDLPASEAYRLIEAAMVVLGVEKSGLTLEQLSQSAFSDPIKEILKAPAPAAIEQARPQTRECMNCNGTGIEGYATSDMATDAGDNKLEGTPVTCRFCDGRGIKEN